MTSPARLRRSIPLFGILIVVGIALISVGLAVAIATRQTVREIDTNSARIRERQVVFGVELESNPVETHFSGQFRDLTGTGENAAWRTVSIKYGTGWFRKNVLNRREHFLFGDVYGDLEVFALHCKTGSISDAECEAMAEELLALLREGKARMISSRVAQIEKQLQAPRQKVSD